MVEGEVSSNCLNEVTIKGIVEVMSVGGRREKKEVWRWGWEYAGKG